MVSMKHIWTKVAPPEFNPPGTSNLQPPMIVAWSDSSIPAGTLKLKLQQFLEILAHRYNYRLLPLLDQVLPGKIFQFDELATRFTVSWPNFTNF